MADSLSFLGIPALCFFFALIKDTVGGEYCYMSGSFISVKYCRYGCCGSTLDRSCCSLGVGMIVGGVVAGIACIFVVVTVVCCCIKKQTYRGRVVGANANNNVTVVHANTQNMAYPGPYNQQARPMGYPQPTPYMYPGPHGYKQPPPPPYLYANPANPAYPPGTAPGGVVGGGGGFAAPAAPAYAPNS